MALFNLTVEDSSPLISYSPAGAWSDPIDDPVLSSYSGNSLHTTSSQDATATINFNGTGISIFGGLRSNYGTYSIMVDGQNVASGNASSQQDEFKQLLGSASGLANGPHTVVLTNTGTSPIDIDFIDIQSQVGTPGSQVTNTTIDDNDPQMSYQPPNAWRLNSNNEFIDGTLHFTNVSSATASVSFSGDAVAIYGTVSSDHANIRVSLDGQTTIYNGGSGGIASTLHPQTLLFFANNLSSERHTLVVSPDQEQNTGLFVDIDAVQVFSATSGSTASTDPAAPVATIPSSSTTLLPSASPDKVSVGKTMPAAAVASIVLGALLAILAILAVIFVILRRRRRKAITPDMPSTEKPISSPKTPELPIQGGWNRSPVRIDPVPQPTVYPQPVHHAPMFSKDQRSRASTFTISSYYAQSRRESMETTSTAPMLRSDVPIIRVPRPPMAYSRPRAPNGLPVRPSQRPPSLELPG